MASPAIMSDDEPALAVAPPLNPQGRVGMFQSKKLFSVGLVLFLGLLIPQQLLAQETVSPDSDLPVLSLDQCIGLALESNPTIMISHERQDIASQSVTEAYGAFLPDLSLTRDWGKSSRTDFDAPIYAPGAFPMIDSGGDTLWFSTSVPTGATQDETVDSEYGTWGGSVNLNVFNGFSKFSTLNSNKSQLKASEASSGYTRELVIEEVSTAYYNLLRNLRLLQVAIETRDQALQELERTETYFRLGSSAKSDVLQQRVRVENTRLDVVVADNNVKLAFVDLAFSMNRPLASAFGVDKSILTTDYAMESVSELYGEALESRLDINSNEHTLDARNSDVTTATAALYPSVNLFGRYSRSDNESPYKFGSQVSNSTTYGYSINWNIFDRMRTWTGRGKAKANVRIAEYELEQARMNVQVEIRQLHFTQLEASKRAAVSRETIIQSQEELRLAQERFRVGAGTTLDVILAQVNLANSRGQEVQAMCDFLIAKSKMDRAVGRVRYPGGDRSAE
jgi:outer membrane protein